MFTFMQTLSNSWLSVVFTCLSKESATSEFLYREKYESHKTWVSEHPSFSDRSSVISPVLYRHVKVTTNCLNATTQRAESAAWLWCPILMQSDRRVWIHHVTVIFHQVKEDVSRNIVALQRKLCYTNFHRLKERLLVYDTHRLYTLYNQP